MYYYQAEKHITYNKSAALNIFIYRMLVQKFATNRSLKNTLHKICKPVLYKAIKLEEIYSAAFVKLSYLSIRPFEYQLSSVLLRAALSAKIAGGFPFGMMFSFRYSAGAGRQVSQDGGVGDPIPS
jgi:hypothetical protein